MSIERVIRCGRYCQQFSIFFLLFSALAANAAPPNLAQFLASAKPAPPGIVLTVGAAQCFLPAGAALPGPDADLGAVASAFGRTLRTFGPVTAAAPLSMTLLNDRPASPNIFDGMAPQDATKFLVASLTQTQWQRLTSDQGLGLDDLRSETQSELFLSVLPHSLLVVPQGEAGGAVRDLTSLRPQARLRLRRRVELMLPEIGGDSYMAANASRNAGQPHYQLVSSDTFTPKDTLYGVPVKEVVPNSPKPGDLDFDSPRLQTAVPIAGAGKMRAGKMGAETVGSLVSRIGRLCGLELYADRHWEDRSVTTLGAAPSAPAADLLRSLAFCLAGTYRKVGPAFVLTDDRLGVGTRRALWAEFETNASQLRKQAIADAQHTQIAAHGQTELSLAPDSVAYTPKQQAQAGQFYAQSGFSSVTQTFNQLSPEQQAAASAVPGSTDQSGVTHAPDLSGKIIVQEVPTLDLLVPTLDGPVDPGLSTLLFNLFPPPAAAEITPAQAPPTALPAPPSLASPSLAALMQPIGARAVLASPHTAAEVRDLVAAMKPLGLNQLWLPVTTTNAAESGSDALLTQAISAAKGTGIAVYAVVGLLSEKEPAADAADLTILGRTAPSAPGAAEKFVSPFSPAVSKELLQTVRRLAATPGLAGQVWQVTEGAGYDDSIHDASPQTALGYTEAARLAFLRQQHTDPVDLFPADARGQADTSLPGFDNAPLEAALLRQWDLFRADADKMLLQSLCRQVKQSAPGSVLLVQQRGAQPPVSWYGSWDTPEAALPVFLPPTQSALPEKVQAQRQSKRILVELPLSGPLSESAILNSWAGPLQQIGKNHSWDGFVLECPAP